VQIKLIANPIAGGNARPQIERLCRYFSGQGHHVDLLLTAARGDAEDAARSARSGGYDRIIAVGGDGTLNEVINGLAPSTIPLAFIPLGTVNVLALEIGLPFDLLAAAEVAVRGVPTPVCLGQAGARKFLLMAGIGFDAQVVRAVDSRLKRRIGRFAYVVAALKTWWHWQEPRLTVTLADGSVQTAGSVIIGNGRLYGGRFSLTPHACLQDDTFEVLLLRRSSRAALLRATPRALLHRPPARGDGLLLRTAALTIAGVAPMQIDGDDSGDLPCAFVTLPGAITLVFPQSQEGKPIPSPTLPLKGRE
jgi:diacylglycerol kinase (ATP)